MLSIVIITKNEEQLLPKLLQSIVIQGIQDFEIIVSDGNSEDKTIEIAKNFGCQVIFGGPNHVTGRNRGAAAAKGDLLLFLDADVILPPGFINVLSGKFAKRKLDCCTVFYRPISKNKIDFILYDIYNYYSWITQWFYPHSAGFCILCKKEKFNKVGGFNERLLSAEDFDFVRRLSKIAKFRVIRDVNILCSIRRIEDWGRKKLIQNYLIAEITRIFKGEMYEGQPFEYTLHGGLNTGKDGKR